MNLATSRSRVLSCQSAAESVLWSWWTSPVTGKQRIASRKLWCRRPCCTLPTCNVTYVNPSNFDRKSRSRSSHLVVEVVVELVQRQAASQLKASSIVGLASVVDSRATVVQVVLPARAPPPELESRRRPVPRTAPRANDGPSCGAGSVSAASRSTSPAFYQLPVPPSPPSP